MALSVSIIYPDCRGHESCNLNSTPGDAPHACLRRDTQHARSVLTARERRKGGGQREEEMEGQTEVYPGQQLSVSTPDPRPQL